MKKILVLFIAPLLLNSCIDDLRINSEYVVFGSFYGMCEGETCVELFKLTDTKLLEDSKNEYPQSAEMYDGDYDIELSQNQFEEAKRISAAIPNQIFDEKETTFGCPDCMDQGGIYLEYKKGDVHERWIIDQDTSAIPEYMHEIVGLINEKVTDFR